MCQGKTDADPTKDPEPGLAKYFALDSTQAIQDELARNRALACKEGLVARGVPATRPVATWNPNPDPNPIPHPLTLTLTLALARTLARTLTLARAARP